MSGDEAYLQASPLSELHAPAGMILPIQVGDYNIPVANSTGAVGKALDIRPPAQPLALVSGARTQFNGDHRDADGRERPQRFCGHRSPGILQSEELRYRQAR
ncbi:outer membrane protein assembly factor BamC [Klebsiella pneumoniae subsp. pneumoniae]|nr:outer membrane protein assembly factor BamC [Klebsiella pneumoniae subsp. pneumoniae]